jgi:hypothetical protein
MSLCHLEGTLGRIQRDLYRAWVYQLSSSSLRSAMGSRTALDESQLPSCGKLPTTKTFYPHQYQHRDRLAPLAQQAKPKVLAAHLAVCGRRGFREYDRHLLRRLRNWYSNAHRIRMHSDRLVTLKLPPYPTEKLQKNPHASSGFICHAVSLG